MALGSITFTVQFLPSADLTSGQLKVTDTTDYAGAGIALVDVVGAVNAFGPDLAQFEVGDLNSPTIDHDVSLTGTYSLPIGADGKVQQGIYKIQLLVRVSGAVDPGDYSSALLEFDLCVDCPTPMLSWDFDCLCGKLTLTDSTNYGDYSVTTRTMTIFAPDPESLTHAPISGPGPSINTSGEDLFTGTYTGRLEVTATKGNLVCTFDYREERKAECDFDLCSLQCCFEATYDRLQKAYDRGHVSNAEELERDLVNMAVLAQLVRQAGECGRTEKAGEYISDIKSLGNCTDSCRCNDGDDPKRITPICSPGSGTTITIQGGTYVEVTLAGGVYTISLTQPAIDILNNVENTLLENSNTTLVGVSVDTGTTPDTRTYQVEVNSKIIQESYACLLEIEVNAAGPIFTKASETLKGNPNTLTTALLVYKAATYTGEGVAAATNPTLVPACVKVDDFYNDLTAQDGYKPEVHVVSTEFKVSPDPCSIPNWIEARPAFRTADTATPLQEWYFQLFDPATGNQLTWDNIRSSAVKITLKVEMQE